MTNHTNGAAEHVDIDALIDELAAMSDVDFALNVKAYAGKTGIGIGDLRQAVKGRKKELDADDDENLPEHWKVEPWGEAVSGADLATDIKTAISRYIVASEEQKVALTLWVLLSWVHNEIATHSPYLLISSPEHECGKSSLLTVLSFMVRCGEVTVDITGATLFRGVHKWGFSLLVDEVEDLFYKADSSLPALMNSAWTRGTSVFRCDGEANKLRRYKIFSPKVFAMIGRNLPPSTLSRCIIIEMQRKMDEVVADYDYLDDDEFLTIRRKCLRWAGDTLETVRGIQPIIPDGFKNRLKCNWALQFAIAEQIGWGDKARKAAGKVANIITSDNASERSMLLSDIYNMFVVGNEESLKSSVIVDSLAKMENRPWPEWKDGRPITHSQLATLLKPFKTLDGNSIEPKNIKFEEDKVLRGYKRIWFKDAFQRYLGIDDKVAAGSGSSSKTTEVAAGSGSTESENNNVNNDIAAVAAKTEKEPLKKKMNGCGQRHRPWDTEGYRLASRRHLDQVKSEIDKEKAEEAEAARVAEQVERIRRSLS